MKRWAAVLLAGGAGFVLVGLAVAGINGNHSVHLTGALEVADPAVETLAQGQAIFQVSKDGSSIDYRLIVANIHNVTQAHIHRGPPGANGPVVVWLYPAAPPPQLIPGRTQGVLATGTITESNFVGPLAGEDMSVLVEWLNTQNAYVNVHTSQYPAGEIRGNF